MLVLRHNILGAETAPAISLPPRRDRRLSVIARRYGPRGRPYIVSVHRPGDTLRPTDDTVRLRGVWSQTLIGRDDIVIITMLPHGGGAGGGNAGKQIGGAIALVALTLAAPYALGAIAPTIFGAAGALTFAGQAAVAGIVIGGSYLIGKMTQARANDTPADGADPLYGVSGGGNLPRPGDRIPVGYGTFVSQPDLTQPDFTIYDGEDQLLYKRMTIGLGKYRVDKIELGAATLWTGEDGVVAPFNAALGGSGSGEIGQGSGGGASSSGGGTEVEIINPGETSALVPGSVYSSPSVGGTELPRVGENPAYAGPFRASPVGKTTSRIQFDWSWPGGINTNGNAAAAFGVKFQYAPCDDDDQPTGAWVDLINFAGSTLTTRGLRFTRILDVPEGHYVVRAQNTIAEAAGITNTITWDGLRSHYPDAITRPNVTEIALKVRSGKSLGVTAFGDLWVTATRILPVWTGSAWEEQPTRKAVYAFKDVLQSDYGAGLADSEVDLERIKHYADLLDANDTFDGVIRGPVSVWEAAAAVLGPIRAEPTRIANTWSLNRDEARSVRRHHVTRRQIVRGTTSSSFKVARNDGAADVIAEYSPDADPRRRRQVRVTFGSQSLTPSRIQLVGVSTHDHAHHIATWRAAAAYYRRERRKVTLDRRGRIIQRGDPARLDSWFMASETRAAGVMERDGLTLALDTPVTVGGTTHAILRDRLNREWGPVKVTAGEGPNVIVLDEADVTALEDDTDLALDDVLADGDQEMTSLLVGPLAEFDDAFLIDVVQPQGRDRVAIEAVIDHPSVWDALGEAPPPAPPVPSVGDIVESAVAVVPWVRARCIQKGVSLEMEWAVGRARGAIQYVVQISYDDGSTWETASSTIETSGSYALRHVDGADVKVGAYAVNRFGVPGPAVYAAFTTFKPVVSSDTATLVVGPVDLAAEVRAFQRSILSRMEDIEDFVGAVLGEQDAQNFLDQFRVARQSVERDGVITTKVETVRDDLYDVSAEVETNTTTIVGLNGSLASLSSTVTSNYNSQQSQITTNATAITTLGGSFSSYQVTVNAHLGTLDSSVSTNATAITTLSGSFSSYQVTVNSQIGSLNSSVSTNATAISTLNGTVSSLSSTVTANYGSLSSSVNSNAVAIAGVQGRMAAFYGLTVDAGGRIASMQLASDGAFAGIKFKADAYVFSLEGYADKGLTLGSVNGVPTFGWAGNMLLDGSVKVYHLEANSITTQKLAADSAVYNRNYSGATSTNPYFNGPPISVTPVSATVPIERGNLMVMGAISGTLGSAFNAMASDTVSAGLYLDGALIKKIMTDFTAPSNGAFGFGDNIFICIPGLSLGNHTVEIRVSVSPNSGVVGSPRRDLVITGSALAVFEPRT